MNGINKSLPTSDTVEDLTLEPSVEDGSSEGDSEDEVPQTSSFTTVATQCEKVGKERTDRK